MPESTLIKFVICLIVLGFLWALSALMVKIKAGMYQGLDRFSLDKLGLGKLGSKLGLKLNPEQKNIMRLEAFALNNTHTLHLLKIGTDRLILLAVSPSQIELILNTDLSQVNLIEPMIEKQGSLNKNDSKIPVNYSENSHLNPSLLSETGE